MPLPVSTESMNDALLDLYTNYLPEIHSLIKSCKWESGLSKPFFMHVSEEYIRAPYKILFVGRETYGWETFNEFDVPIPSTELYKNVYESNKHYNSPFWWFREELSTQLGIEENFMKATMWTNLSKIDVNKRTPSGENSGELAQLFMKLLVEEIKIIQPDIIIILTKDGHYNWHLNNYDWVQNQVFKDRAIAPNYSYYSFDGHFCPMTWDNFFDDVEDYTVKIALSSSKRFSACPMVFPLMTPWIALCVT